MREAVCRKVLDALKPFCALEEGELPQAVLLAALLSYGTGVRVPETDLEAIIKWAEGVQTNAVMLQFVLCGAASVAVENGEVSFAMTDPAATMSALVREGVAKKSSPAAPDPPLPRGPVGG